MKEFKMYFILTEEHVRKGLGRDLYDLVYDEIDSNDIFKTNEKVLKDIYEYGVSIGYTKTLEEFLATFGGIRTDYLVKHIAVEPELKFVEIIDEDRIKVSVDMKVYPKFFDSL